MSPDMATGEYSFCRVTGPLVDYASLEPVGTFREKEGLTLILPTSVAELHKLVSSGSYRQITLNVHSSLEAVGLTAVVSTALARNGISANVVAGFYHDHIYVPSSRADRALAVLRELTSTHKGQLPTL